QKDPARLAEFMNLIGAGRAGLDLVALGPQRLGERLEDARRVGVLSAEMAGHAAQMQNAWAQMVLSAEHIGRIMADLASGPLITAFNAIRDFLITVRPFLTGGTLQDLLGTGPVDFANRSGLTAGWGSFWTAKPGEWTVKDALGFLSWAVSGGNGAAPG